MILFLSDYVLLLVKDFLLALEGAKRFVGNFHFGPEVDEDAGDKQKEMQNGCIQERPASFVDV